MRDTLRSEFAYQLFALLFAALFVHAIYVTAIRPEAETLLAEQRAAAAAQQQQMEQASMAAQTINQGAQAAKVLSEADTTNPNALTALLQGGGGLPRATA